MRNCKLQNKGNYFFHEWFYKQQLNKLYCSSSSSSSSSPSSEMNNNSPTFIDKSSLKIPIEGSLRTKVRQHVNPLASKYQQPCELDDNWLNKVYENSQSNIIIDIGCAKGTFCLKYAANHPNHNILGLEIRKPIVELALSRKERWNLNNVHFLSSNANVDLKNILNDINNNNVQIDLVSIQFPDPYFKKRQMKRRVVNDDLINILAELLQNNTKLYIQSDIEDLEKYMVEVIHKSPYFDSYPGYDSNQLISNPSATGILTEREIATDAKNLPVYRMLYRRNEKLYEN